MTRRGWLLFVAMCVIWGLPYLFIRVAVEHASPGALVFLRTAVAAVILVPIAVSRGQLRPVLRHWPAVVLFTGIEVLLPWLMLSDAERKLSSSLAGLLVAAVPLIGALLALLSVHGERFGPVQLVGLSVGLIGVISLVGLDLGQLHPLAMLEMLLVSIGYALGPLVLAKYLTGLPGLGVMGASMSLAAVLTLPLMLLQPPRSMPARGWLSVLVLGVICTALAFTLFFQLIAEIGPTRCTIITYVNPAVAVLLGVLVLGEQLTAGMLVGFPLILLGSVLAARARRVELPHDLPPGPTAAAVTG